MIGMDNPSESISVPNSLAAERLFRGIGVSPGLALGRVFVKQSHDERVSERAISQADVPREIARFEEALIATRRQLREFQQECDPAVASIFDAHLLILDDRPLSKTLSPVLKVGGATSRLSCRMSHRGFMQSLSRVKTHTCGTSGGCAGCHPPYYE